MPANQLRLPSQTINAWVGILIIAVGAALRLASLDLKPAHFDEGVNGWFVDGMTHQGYYHYDPANFHGPLHFYALFVSQTLLGRNLWALRLPTALASIGCIVLVLAFRCYLPRRACFIAAFAMAVSPGMVFYGRDAIHETWLVFFLLLALWGFIGWREIGAPRHLWSAALGCTGMILTKETYVIHFVAFAFAAAWLLLLERAHAGTPVRATEPRWTRADARHAAVVCVGLIVFFYTGGLLDWPDFRAANNQLRGSLAGLVETFAVWGRRGMSGETGQEKPWSYWWELLASYEWTALAGVLAATLLFVPRRHRAGGDSIVHDPARPIPNRIRIFAATFLFPPRGNWLPSSLAVYGVATLAAYSLISYKTPWCLIAMMPPFYLLFGIAIDRGMARFDRWVVGSAAVLLCAGSLTRAWLLNFRDFTNEDEPYVYVQTLPDINKLLDPLRTLVRLEVSNYHLSGCVMTTEHHPLPWLLGDFTQLHLLTPDDMPDPIDADFLLIDETRVDAVEAVLTSSYFKEPLRIRGNADDSSMLYLKADKFRVCFPAREPEFVR